MIEINENLTLAVQWIKFVGFGISWWRRSMFDYGHVSISLPFFEIILEWSPDWDAYNERFGTL